MPTDWVVRMAAPQATTYSMRKSQGVLHCPDTKHPPRTALIAAHYSHDFMSHYLADPLVNRGYGFLGWNNRFVGSDAFFRPDFALLDLATGVRYLRERFEQVVLLGNSGGGSLMSAYQSLACGNDQVGPAMLEIYGDTADGMSELEPCDAYIALNSHESRPKILTDWMDPSVSDEDDPFSSEPSLDLWGDVAGTAPYDEEYVRIYRAAQRVRNFRITERVRERLAIVERHGGADQLFTVFRSWADPRFLDLSLDPSDREVGCYLSDDVRTANNSAYGLSASSTLRTWLSMWSLEFDVLNVARHLPNVKVPSLVLQGTADKGVFPTNALALHEFLGASDKSLTWIKGGGHYLEGAHLDQAVSAIDRWLRERDFGG